jgi:hypothetical protein
MKTERITNSGIIAKPSRVDLSIEEDMLRTRTDKSATSSADKPDTIKESFKPHGHP